MDMEKMKCCGTCWFNKYDADSDGAFVCNNSDSEYFACWTDYDDYCEEWKAR